MDTNKLDFSNSTNPELSRLEEHYSAPEELRGRIVKWAELESVLGLRRADPRFQTVVGRWRRRLEMQHDIMTDGKGKDVIGVGFRVLTEDEQVLHFTKKQYREAGRRIVRGHRASASVDDSKLSAEAKRQKDFNVLAGRHIHSAIVESRTFKVLSPAPPETKPERKTD